MKAKCAKCGQYDNLTAGGYCRKCDQDYRDRLRKEREAREQQEEYERKKKK